MTNYSIYLSSDAQQDLDNIFNYINFNFQNEIAAEKFIKSAYKTIRSLKYFPEKYITVNNTKFPEEILHRAPFLRYSIFYKIDENEKKVIVVAVTYNGTN